jgi:hypothetical protein
MLFLIYENKNYKLKLRDCNYKHYKYTKNLVCGTSDTRQCSSTGVSTAIRLWKPINLKTLEDGDDTFSETAVRTNATQYEVPEDILLISL